jgi:prolyl oligopeptidase
VTDQDLWLEEVEGADALAWVRSHNDRSLTRLQAHPDHDRFLAAATEALTTEDRIVYASLRGGYAYDFWQDAEHVKGIWRRSPADAYLADEPVWETLLDIDRLAADEAENWVFGGAAVLWDDGAPTDRYLISLSIGGRDATTVREFNLATRTFVDGEDTFLSPEAKQSAVWLDHDRVLLATDWGDGTTTDSGYPRTVRLWRRGQDWSESDELLAGEQTDVGVWPFTLERADGTVLAGAVQRRTFFTGTYWLLPELTDSTPHGETTGRGEPLAVPIPARADIVGVYRDHVIVSLQEDWTVATADGPASFASGSVVSFDLVELLETGEITKPLLLFAPTDRQAVQGVSITSERVLLSYTDTVAARLAWLDVVDGSWTLEPVDLPGTGAAHVTFADDKESTVLLSYQDFLTPDSLYRLDAAAQPEDRRELSVVRAGTARFDATGLTVGQHFATSADGTEVPYFLVHRSDLQPDASTPTLLYGYGGFEISLTPSYSATIGKLWLAEGGAYAVANIRGGGEFGPAWHQAGLKQKRQVVYDDFIAVAEDLIDRGVTASSKLGIMGGSNGGLLMGVMLTQRPELWSAVVIQVPLLDMLRFHLLLAGASWVDEYGSPDVPDERQFLETLSPYHRFDPAADYPEPFFVTSTKDDRVHPGHARKMAKRFEEAGKPFLYFENIDGGHGAATTQLERAARVALEFTYLTDKLRS